MTDDAARFFVLTGGPGAGKSTLIDALAAAGVACSAEAGRAVIQAEIAGGGRALPGIDPLAFAKRMLGRDLHSYAEARERAGPVFFDRGIPDVVAICGSRASRCLGPSRAPPRPFATAAVSSSRRRGRTFSAGIASANRISTKRCEPTT